MWACVGDGIGRVVVSEGVAMLSFEKNVIN